MINYLDKFKLEKKNVFITGACGLIGQELVSAAISLGATVVMLDIDEEKSMAVKESFIEVEDKLFFEKMDVTDLELAGATVSELIRKYEKIDVWINSAYPRTADWGNKVEDISLESWRKNVEMHLNSYSWISKEVCLRMKESSGGSIVNFASIYGVVAPDFSVYDNTTMTMPMGYSAIKGGIVNLSRYLASYFGPFDVRVNSICPGGVLDRQNEEFVKNYSNKVPLKRMAEPEEIASATMFLASDASSYINGVTLMVDGGWSIV